MQAGEMNLSLFNSIQCLETGFYVSDECRLIGDLYFVVPEGLGHI